MSLKTIKKLQLVYEKHEEKIIYYHSILRKLIILFYSHEQGIIKKKENQVSLF